MRTLTARTTPVEMIAGWDLQRPCELDESCRASARSSGRPRVRSGCCERACSTRNDGSCHWGEDDAAIARDHVSCVAVAPSCVVSAPGRHGLTDAWLVPPDRVTLFHGDSIRASTLPRPVIVRRREHLRDHDADPIDQDDRRDGCRVSRLADAAKELPRSPGQLEVADEQRDRSDPAPPDAPKAKCLTTGPADATIKRQLGHADRAGREPRLGTIVKLARALAYPPCEVVAGI
jgi:hypothetical protein